MKSFDDCVEHVAGLGLAEMQAQYDINEVLSGAIDAMPPEAVEAFMKALGNELAHVEHRAEMQWQAREDRNAVYRRRGAA